MLRGAQVSLAGRDLYHLQTMRIAPADAGQKFPHTRRLEWGLNPIQCLAMRRIRPHSESTPEALKVKA